MKDDKSLMSKSTKLGPDIYDINYSYTDIFLHLTTDLIKKGSCQCSKKKKKILSSSQYKFNQAYKKVEGDLEYLGILKSINKMKAALSILVGDDRKMMAKIKHNFEAQSYLWTDEDEDLEEVKNNRNRF